MTNATLFEEFGADRLKRSSVRGAVVTLLAQLAKFAVQFGAQVALARLLDPASFGLVALAAPAVGLALIVAELGLDQAVVQRALVSQTLLSSLFWTSAALHATAAVLLFLLAPVYAAVLGWPELAPVVRVLVVLVVSAGLTVVPGALLNRRLRFTHLAAIDLAGLLAGAAAGVAAAAAGAGYWALVINQAGASLTCLLLTWALLRWVPSLWISRGAGLRATLSFGAHLAGANLAAYAGGAAANTLLGLAAGTTELGLYDRSLRLAVLPLSQVMAPVSRVAVPVLSRLQEQGGSYAAAYLFMLQAALLVTVPGLLALIGFARQILPALLGPQWTEATPVFAWAGVGGLAISTYVSTGWLLSSQGRGRAQLHRNVGSAAIGVLAAAGGVWWGAAGVAASGALSYVLVQTPLAVWIATRTGPVTLAAVLKALGPFGLAITVTAVAALAWLPNYARGSGLWVAALAAAACYAVFATVLLAQKGGRAFLGTAWQLRGSAGRG